LYPDYPYIETKSGIQYICSFTVNSISTPIAVVNILGCGNQTAEQYFIDGTAVTSSTTVTGPCIVSVRVKASSTNWYPRLGLGTQGTNVSGTLVISKPIGHQGSVPKTYVQNANTSSAYQTPRFDYDPTTLTPRGLLIEGSATNLLNWSESFASSGGTNNNWTDTSISRTTGQTDPAKGTTAIRFTASAGNATVISSAAIGTSAQRTFSIWLRRVTGTGNIQFTTDNGTTWTTQAITSSWVRYTFPATTSAQQVGIRIVTNADAIEMWGAQLETGSGASSYISTGASQATRAADSCVMSGTNFSPWFNATQGTLLATWSGTGITSGRYATINDGSASNQIWVGYTESAIYNGSFQASFGTAATANGKVALAYATNDAAWCFNGASVSTVTSVTLPTGLNQIVIGNSQAGTASINTSLKSIKFFPTRLTNATLQSLTA
jgi:hypothetical protein